MNFKNEDLTPEQVALHGAACTAAHYFVGLCENDTLTFGPALAVRLIPEAANDLEKRDRLEKHAMCSLAGYRALLQIAPEGSPAWIEDQDNEDTLNDIVGVLAVSHEERTAYRDLIAVRAATLVSDRADRIKALAEEMVECPDLPWARSVEILSAA